MVPSVTDNSGQVVAFIDIGTYSVRLLIARFNPNQSFTVLSEQKEQSRLGVGEIFEQRLEQEAMLRTAVICSKFVRMAEGFGAEQIIAVATAATRDARNRRRFLHLLQREAGLDVRVISGKEEARLIYLGVSRGYHLDGRTTVFIDIGGGSTELIVGDEQEPMYLTSLRMGSIRLSQTFQLNDPTSPITPQHYQLVCQHVCSAAVRAIQSIKPYEIDLCLGSSGTINNLAEIAAKMFPDSAPTEGLVLRHDHLREVTQRLCALPLDERRKVPGINPSRADIILGGAAIIECLMGQLNIEQVVTSPRGLRDGLLIDYVGRRNPAGLEDHFSIRRRSVLLLARRCGFDEDHAKRVSHLAMDLFDSGSKMGLHPYGEKERELLGYAGLLHDIGVFLSFENHHAHTYYLIRNADLLGFDQTEIAMIAAIARYHRKGAPRKNHPEVADLSKAQRTTVYQLGVLLRIAESLDRSHSGVIANAELVEAGKKTVALEPRVSGDSALEMWGVQKQVRAFEKAFGCKLVINLTLESPTAQETTKVKSINEPVTSG